MADKLQELIDAYQEMYELTEPECSHNCNAPRMCCHSSVCEQTISHAREKYGIELQTTGHPTLPLMGPRGCVALPHHRPSCAVHTCAVNAFGGKDDEAWNDRYFDLRARIGDLEIQAHPVYYKNKLGLDVDKLIKEINERDEPEKRPGG